MQCFHNSLEEWVCWYYAAHDKLGMQKARFVLLNRYALSIPTVFMHAGGRATMQILPEHSQLVSNSGD